MNKKIKCTAVVLTSLMLFTGCGNGIKKVAPLTLEEVAGNRLAQMSADEKESLIYKYVTDRITVESDRLIDITGKDLTAINNLFSSVNECLKGVDNKALPNEYANYLLMEFSKTPYEWKQSKIDAVGYDPAARLYFVDVTYSTTSTLKTALPDSRIANGSPNEETLKEKRYEDYIKYLDTKVAGDNGKAQEYLSAFKSTWGDVGAIRIEQQGTSLLKRTRAYGDSTGGIGKLTYSGLVSESKLIKPAEMTIRYVLKYNFNLGEETDLSVNSLYVKNYALGNPDDILKNLESSDDTGVEVLKPFIDRLITSYHKAVEEYNNVGLYSLFQNYNSVDKYYDDVNNYSYLSIGNFTYKVLQRSGTEVMVQVNREVKTRARGAEMSLPTYEETLLFNLVLCNDDTIRIKSVTPLKSTIVGEPVSVIESVSGISDLIQYSGESFTETNKTKVEDAIKQFGDVVINNKVDSDLVNKVDLGVSQSTLQKLVDTITATNANEKATYIVSWNTKTNAYCELTLREIFMTDAGAYDTESSIALVNRNGDWKIVNYTRTLNVKTSKTDLDTSSALCVNKKGENVKSDGTTLGGNSEKAEEEKTSEGDK